MICQIEGCGKAFYARGWCHQHYMRWRRHGDPLACKIAEDGKPRAFIAAALEYEGDECLLWPFGKKQGYATVRWNGKSQMAHPIVCEAAHGPKPPDKTEVAHSCGKKPCINKRHLRWATRIENKADDLIHGVRVRGTRHTGHKLTEQQVLAIRESRKSQRLIAAEYGIGQMTVSNIKTGRTWGWL